ncbi:hypothetical protein EJ110_NYTH46112 [Nymphaea thermarum]|nr:hypothetical protein EJ110_NYTH46112 [Nymphaea thermarum]
MAAFSPRSPSPLPERSSASFRSTDTRNATKRAQNANSGMKTNSPSDFHQRSSGVRERSVSPSLRASFEHKEDDRDENRHVPKLARSGPLPSFSKGTKNFMAPTISAASKVAASPRKKVLSERNSVDHNASPFSSTSSPQVQEPEAFSRTTVEDRSVVNVKNDSEPEEPKNPKILPRASPNDASLPPYDPHVNFLSPRPEFLRYSPNPRLERYRRDDKPAIKKRLESSFASESSLTAEEELQENSGSEIGFTGGLEGDYHNEENHSSETGFTTGLEPDGDNEENRPSEIEASSELESTRRILPSDETKSEKENQQGSESSSPELGAKVKAQGDVAEAEFGVSKGSCSKSYLKPKLIKVVLVLAIASLCLPMIDSPLLLSSLMYHGNVSRSCCVSLVEENVCQETFSIADLAESRSYSGTKQLENMKAEHAQTEDASVTTPVLDYQISALKVADSIASVEFPEPEVIMATSVERPLSEIEVDGVMEYANEVPLPPEEVIAVVDNEQSITEVEASIPESTTLDSLAELSSTEESEMQAPFTEDLDPTTSSGLPKQEAIEEPSAPMDQLKHPTSLRETLGIQVVLGVLLIALTVVAVTYRQTNNNRKMEYVKMKATDDVQDNIGHRPLSELEMTGESYSMEMSSTTSEKTMRYPRRAPKETEEVILKYERSRRPKRGSSVSNSDDSLSYGSFTTYEKLPTKQGSADEGTVTPVRRSSRINKQTISS